MSSANRHQDVRVVNAVASWKKWIKAVQLLLRRLAMLLEHLQTAVDDAGEVVDTEPEAVPPAIRRRRRSYRAPRGPLPFATALSYPDADSVAFTVASLESRLRLSLLRMDLLSLLGTSKPSDDELVGTKSTASLVHALRLRGWEATTHSVTVEIGRLREALGPANRGLIENRRGVGYRFRVLRSVAVAVDDQRARSGRLMPAGRLGRVAVG
jgi:DNA-binding response OmpR family regulator